MIVPISNTVFSLALFGALLVVLRWGKRRRRASDSARRVVAGMRATLRD
jgi:hypothetical protein